jgi:hypothetical protein
MKRYVVLMIVSLTLPTLSWAGTDPIWYSVGDGPTGRLECLADKPDGGLVSMVRMLGDTGLRYRLDDVTEQGQVVETTLTAPDIYAEPQTWYRTKARCEQAMRTRAQAYKAGQQQRERQLDKYR